MLKIQINPDIRKHISPLRPEERKELEASIKAEGCRDPLVVWEQTGFIVDGHNRYDICQEHNIRFNTVWRKFDTMIDAMVRLGCVPLFPRPVSLGAPRGAFLAGAIFLVAILLTSLELLPVQIALTMAALAFPAAMAVWPLRRGSGPDGS